MYAELYDLLEYAMLDDARVEVVSKCGRTFSGISCGVDEADDDLGWSFRDVTGWPYGMIHFKDIVSVKRLDTGEVCVASQMIVQQMVA